MLVREVVNIYACVRGKETEREKERENEREI